MDQSADRSRIPGLILIATGIAAFVLLLNHPDGQATDFAGLLKEEAANRLMNGIVHGGFIAVLAIQLAGYAIFCRRAGWSRSWIVAGMVFFAVGTAAQMASLLLDGLVTPALAARYLAAPPDRLPYARSLFVYTGALIQLLMPMGMFFQAAGIASWGVGLMTVARGAGLIGLTLGLAVAAAMGSAFITGEAHVLMLGIVGLAVWAVIAGALMVQRNI